MPRPATAATGAAGFWAQRMLFVCCSVTWGLAIVLVMAAAEDPDIVRLVRDQLAYRPDYPLDDPIRVDPILPGPDTSSGLAFYLLVGSIVGATVLHTVKTEKEFASCCDGLLCLHLCAASLIALDILGETSSNFNIISCHPPYVDIFVCAGLTTGRLFAFCIGAFLLSLMALWHRFPAYYRRAGQFVLLIPLLPGLSILLFLLATHLSSAMGKQIHLTLVGYT